MVYDPAVVSMQHTTSWHWMISCCYILFHPSSNRLVIFRCIPDVLDLRRRCRLGFRGIRIDISVRGRGERRMCASMFSENERESSINLPLATVRVSLVIPKQVKRGNGQFVMPYMCGQICWVIKQTDIDRGMLEWIGWSDMDATPWCGVYQSREQDTGKLWLYHSHARKQPIETKFPGGRGFEA